MLPQGFFIPLDYGHIVGVVWVAHEVVLIALANGYVVLKPCQGGPIDLISYPDNHENRRGMVDVYGQLSPLYATQKGGQMEPTGKMIRRLLEAV